MSKVTTVMKFRLNIHLIICNGKSNQTLLTFHCTGIISTNALPRVEEFVCLNLDGNGRGNCFERQKVENIFYDLASGVMIPDVYLENYEFDLADRMSDLVSENQALTAQVRWIRTAIIPALKKQGFESFECYK